MVNVPIRYNSALNPVSQDAMSRLLVGIAGTTLLEIHFPYLDRLHISAGHIGAAVTAVLAGAAVTGIIRKIKPRLA